MSGWKVLLNVTLNTLNIYRWGWVSNGMHISWSRGVSIYQLLIQQSVYQVVFLTRRLLYIVCRTFWGWLEWWLVLCFTQSWTYTSAVKNQIVWVYFMRLQSNFVKIPIIFCHLRLFAPISHKTVQSMMVIWPDSHLTFRFYGS